MWEESTGRESGKGAVGVPELQELLPRKSPALLRSQRREKEVEAPRSYPGGRVALQAQQAGQRGGTSLGGALEARPRSETVGQP